MAIARGRSLTAALLFLCLAFGSGPLVAAPAPQVYFGGRAVPCSPPPVLIDGEVHVPTSFSYAGLPVTVSTQDNVVVVRGPGELEARVPAISHAGALYYPLARACERIRLSARWVERAGKLYIAPRTDSIRPEMFDRLLTLRVNAGYPITGKVQVLKDPDRLQIEIHDAHLFAEETTIPVGQAGIARVRAAQVSYEPCVVRIWVDTEGPPQYRALSTQATTQIRVRAGVPESQSPESLGVLDRLLDSPDSEASELEVTSVEVGTDGAGNARVVVRTTGRPQAQVLRLSAPPRIALDVQNATLRAQVPPVPPDTPLVQGIRLGQFTANVARVVVDLTEEAEGTLSEGDDPGSLVLTVRQCAPPVRVDGLKGLKVMVDPGHGGSLQGTTGLSGRREQDINLDVARRLYRLLEAAEARPSMTRYGDDTVGLRARPAMANSQGVHLFISIHCNSNGSANSARGIETYYCHSHSYRLARAVHNRLVRELGAPDRRVRRRPGLVVTRETKMPSILVEIGYMNHREEDRLLGTPEYRQRVAKAIFNGIAEYVGAPAGTQSGTAEEAPPAAEEGDAPALEEEGQ